MSSSATSGLNETLPSEICEKAGLTSGDKIEWRFEAGEIRGRRVVPECAEILRDDELDPDTLLPKEGSISPQSIVRSLRAVRDHE